MKLSVIAQWLDDTLEISKFDDVSNNGVQLSRRGDEVNLVAFAVDASCASVEAAVRAGAQLLVVHHGISWGGGIKKVSGGVYNVLRAAMDGDLAIYAAHLPLDANKAFGNNWELARKYKLRKVSPAFNYHGNIIGVVGFDAEGRKIGICSGGAAEFAEDAKNLGCDEFITGEANWGDVIAAENIDMKVTLLGHYESETYGVKALSKAMSKALKIKTVFVGRDC